MGCLSRAFARQRDMEDEPSPERSPKRVTRILVVLLVAGILAALAARVWTGERNPGLASDAFVVLVSIGLLVWGGRYSARWPLDYVAACLLFVGGAFLAAFLGLFAYGWPGAEMLALLFDNIGQYPGGPDAPFFIAGLMWAISVLALCLLAGLIVLTIQLCLWLARRALRRQV